MKHPVLYIVILMLLTGCGGKRPAEETSAAPVADSTITLTDAQVANAGISTGKLEMKAISSVLKVNGRIDVPPQNMVSISVPLGGYLKTTKLLPGMHVNKGDVIAVMEDQQYIQLQQDYLTAKARLGFLEPDYLRQKELNASQASSDKVYQQAEADYKSQRVLITSLGQKLELAGINPASISETSISRSINIHSPINGYVAKVNVNIGKYVSPTDVLFELINPKDIHLALQVFEKDLDKLFIGQKLMAYTNNRPDKKYRCEILLTGKDLSPEGNTSVHCHFEEYDKTLVPGTYMNADIEIKNKQALVLPEEAVVQYHSRHYVFIQQTANQFMMAEITTGDAENGFIEITGAGKIATAAFVTKGAYAILMSLKNKPAE